MAFGLFLEKFHFLPSVFLSSFFLDFPGVVHPFVVVIEP